MKVNVKSEKGAITLIALVTMLFLISFLMTMYIRISNKAQTSAETTAEIAKRYNNVGDANVIYDSYFATEEVIPITNKEQLAKIGSGEQVEVNGKLYTFSSDGYYAIQNSIDLGGYDKSTNTWISENEWLPLPHYDESEQQYEFTGTLDGLGHTISGIYINSEEDNQGLFGTLEGTVKNLNINNSQITGNSNVGGVAGTNEGTITKCHSKAEISGNNNFGLIFGNNNGVFKDNYAINLFDYTPELSEIMNTKYGASADQMAVIPKGFTISEDENETSIEDGLVIKDDDGNEFVWVPVEITKTDSETSIAAMKRTNWENNAPKTGLSTSNKEPYTNGYETEVQEYNDMLESVYKYRGFYIGRYEAGSETARYNSTSNGTTQMSVKKGKYPYSYVGWASEMNNYEEEVIDTNSLNQGYGAVKLSKDLYEEKDVGVVSTLIYGSQWDATLRFIKDEEHNVNDSKDWGNYTNADTFTFEGKYCSTSWKSDSTIKENGKSILLQTGASERNKAKNIYDLAGNVREWTMEAYSSTKRVTRGGSYNFSGDFNPASYRSSYVPNEKAFFIGFRVALYINLTN